GQFGEILVIALDRFAITDELLPLCNEDLPNMLRPFPGCLPPLHSSLQEHLLEATDSDSAARERARKRSHLAAGAGAVPQVSVQRVAAPLDSASRRLALAGCHGVHSD